LLGAVVGSRSTALLGAAVVVLLNIGRLVAGGANLALVPFRDGLDWSKMKKPLARVIDPIVTIGVVILAFTFIPWLSAGGGSPSSGAPARKSGGLRSTIEALEKRTVEELEKAIALGESKNPP